MEIMKKINSLGLLCIFGLVVLSSCKKEPDENVIIDYLYSSHFKMINNSGVQVAVVAGNKDFPDSLVLVNGATYEWSMERRQTIWPADGCFFSKVYFDKDVRVVHDRYDISNRNPGAPGDYDMVIIDKFNTNYTFIFTSEDYQNALEQQK